MDPAVHSTDLTAATSPGTPRPRSRAATAPMLLLLLVGSLLLLAGCGDDGGSGDDGGNGASATTTTPGDGEPEVEADRGGDDGRGPASDTPPELALQRVGDFEQPLDVTWAPGADGIVVLEKPGRAWLVGTSPGGPREGILDLRGEVSTGAEQGLLGIAFHPGFAENGRFFINYTDPRGDTRIEEWRSEPGDPTAGAGRVRELLHVEQPFANHNGGHLEFGPDGRLYAGLGDGGGAGDPHQNGQDPDSLLGKLLRFDVDSEGGDEGISPVPVEQWAIGLRNPWRFSFDRKTDDLWIGDVGQNELEEVDLLPAGTGAGANLGWDAYEGTEPYEGGGELDASSHVPPVWQYGHDDGCSVTGGVVYRGTEIRQLQGWYLVADFCSTWLRMLPASDALEAAREGRTLPVDAAVERDGTPSVASFGEDADGEIYVASLSENVVWRLVAADAEADAG